MTKSMQPKNPSELFEWLKECQSQNVDRDWLFDVVTELLHRERREQLAKAAFEMENGNLQEQLTDASEVIRDFRAVAAEFATLKAEIERNDDDRFFVGVSVGIIDNTIQNSELEDLDL